MSISLTDAASALSDEALQLILLPTEQCNFRCVYCFESFQIGKMSACTINGVKNLLTSRFEKLAYLAIAWFGGEPLLALDVIESISSHIRSLLVSRPTVRIKASITTNAYLLTPDVFRTLLDWDIFTYQISFDGLQELHDQKRVLANGKPTFKRLWDNVKAMKTFTDRFAVTVRLHVDCDNAIYAPDFLKQFAQDFGDDNRFSIYVKKLDQYASSPQKHLNLLDTEDADQLMKDLYSLGEQLHISVRAPRREDHGGYSTCFAAKLNSFVIRADGQVSKCIVALDNSINHVGTISEDGKLSFDHRKLLAWARGISSGTARELECPLRDIENWVAN